MELCVKYIPFSYTDAYQARLESEPAKLIAERSAAQE